MYLSILESQGKYADAFKVVDGPLGLLCKVESERERICIDLLQKSNQWKLVEERSSKLLLSKYH